MSPVYVWYVVFKLSRQNDAYMHEESRPSLTPDGCQAIIWTNAGISLIEPLGINFGEIWSKLPQFSYVKNNFKMASILSHPQCVKMNVILSSELPFCCDRIYNSPCDCYFVIIDLLCVRAFVKTLCIDDGWNNCEDIHIILTHWGRATHICVSKLGYHWYR